MTDARAHRLIFDEHVDSERYGESPERDVEHPPRGEPEAKVVVLLVLCPLLDGGISGQKVRMRFM